MLTQLLTMTATHKFPSLVGVGVPGQGEGGGGQRVRTLAVRGQVGEAGPGWDSGVSGTARSEQDSSFTQIDSYLSNIFTNLL